MEFIEEEIKNQVADKLDNMCDCEISSSLYEFLKDKEEIIAKSVYEVLNNNECVVNTKYCHCNAQEGFDEDLILDWEYIDSLSGVEREKEIQSTILYNYDALWMTAIHKAFPNNTTNTQCGYGAMEMLSDIYGIK